MDRPAFLYATAPDAATAEAIAQALIEAHLAACVNVVPAIRSVYRWRGVVERGEEAAMIVKTTAALAKDAAARLKALHPYDTPAISEIVLGAATDADFAAWIATETVR